MLTDRPSDKPTDAAPFGPKKGSCSISMKFKFSHIIKMIPRKLYVKLEKKLLNSFKKNQLLPKIQS